MQEKFYAASSYQRKCRILSNMNVDTERQWFVYFKETEMGPFPEPELVSKIKSGEFDETAFVFTDGMSDWELIKESGLKTFFQSTKTPVTNVVEINSKSQSQSSSAYSDQAIVKESLGSQKQAAANEIINSITTPKQNRFGLKSVAAVLFVVIIGTGYVLNKDLVSSFFSNNQENQLIDLSKETPEPQAVNVQAAQDTSVNWNELDTFVKIMDPQGPAFRLANKTLGGMRPIVVGAVSPGFKVNYLTIALFPDNDRSLYAIPPLWISDVGVQSGYFSVGPHLNRGQDLLPGRYRVLVASGGKFLGDASVDIGEFPLGNALETKKSELISEVQALSGSEKDQVKQRQQWLIQASQKLAALEALATGGASKKKAWNDQKLAALKEAVQNRELQSQVLQGPMFYPTEQNLVMSAVVAWEQLLLGLDHFSAGGDAAVKAKLGAPLSALKGGFVLSMQKIDAPLKEIDAREITKPLTISAENIKLRLIEESK